MFTSDWFFDLEKRLIDAGLDSDEKSFAEIKSNLQNPKKLNADEFAAAAIYVVLAGGFSQKTAKTIHNKIMKHLASSQFPSGKGVAKSAGVSSDDLLKLFNNKNKINAVVKIWENRNKYRDEYYGIGIEESLDRRKTNQSSKNLDNNQDLKHLNSKFSNLNSSSPLYKKIYFLSTLPHIGKITANHLARNLGENVVKYDIWIQRLGVDFAIQNQLTINNEQLTNTKINNQKLHPDIKNACDAMFAHLSEKTGLPIGYIDVVLWKACQNGLVKLKDK